MGEKFGSISTIDPINQQHDPHDHKNIADHPPCQLDSYEHPDDGHRHVKRCFRTGAIINGFKIKNPVSYTENGKEYQQIVDNSHEFVLWFVNEKDEDIGNNNVYPPMILCGRRSQNRRIGVKKDQSYG